MKLRTEICDFGEEEIVIRCKAKTDVIKNIESALESIIGSSREMVLHLGGAEYYIPVSDILFFESSDGKVYAHTSDAVYTAEHKLFELENILPASFVRISKSAIVNVMLISSLKRELVGNGEITFKSGDKKTYFSRGYYHVLRDKIDEMRLRK